MSADFLGALREVDRNLGAFDSQSEARVRGRLAQSLYARRTQWKYPVLALASCAAGVAIALVLLRPTEPRVVAGVTVQARSPGFEAVAEGADVVVRGGEGTLQVSGATLRVNRPGRLRRESGGVRVVAGRFELEVKKRAAAEPPLRVWVSDGEIEVRGTRFSVDQIEGGGGAALLWEGSIVFRTPDGRQVELKPGESLAWPLPAASPKGAAPSEADQSFVEADDELLMPLPAPSTAGAPPKSAIDWSAHDRLLRARTLLERIPRLRAGGAIAQAAAELEDAMRQDLPAAARERLSWMLIDIYASDLWQTDKACRQIREHEWRYPAGRYEREVAAMRLEMSCER